MALPPPTLKGVQQGCTRSRTPSQAPWLGGEGCALSPRAPCGPGLLSALSRLRVFLPPSAVPSWEQH